MKKPQIAFFGLGTMGSGMARRLLAAGFPLTIYNRSSRKTVPFVKEGADLARSPREAAGNADFILSMVADDDAARGIWLLLRLMAKDLAYAAAEAKRHALDPVTAAAALKVFQQAIRHGDAESDLSAVV